METMTQQSGGGELRSTAARPYLLSDDLHLNRVVEAGGVQEVFNLISSDGIQSA